MVTKPAVHQKRKQPAPPSRNTRRGARTAAGAKPIPSSADYDDEVTDEQLRQIRDGVKQDLEEEELEIVDGPAW